MFSFLKIIVTSILVLFALTACKPGIYYPFGNTNAQPSGVTDKAAPSPTLGTVENRRM